MKRRLKAEADERTRQRTLTEEQREEVAAADMAAKKAAEAKDKEQKVSVSQVMMEVNFYSIIIIR